MFTVKIYLSHNTTKDVPDVLKENITDLDIAVRIATSYVEDTERVAYIEDGNDVLLRKYKGLKGGYICNLMLR